MISLTIIFFISMFLSKGAVIIYGNQGVVEFSNSGAL